MLLIIATWMLLASTLLSLLTTKRRVVIVRTDMEFTVAVLVRASYVLYFVAILRAL